MRNLTKASTCTPCKKRRSSSFSWMPALMVAILPKCPFCVMAYSGAITMCSGNNLYPNAGGIMSYVTIGLALLVLVSLVFNHKGKKTYAALVIALLGVGMLFLSQVYTMSSPLYYGGVIMLFFGIWYNGSFFHFYRKYISNRISNNIKTTYLK